MVAASVGARAASGVPIMASCVSPSSSTSRAVQRTAQRDADGLAQVRQQRARRVERSLRTDEPELDEAVRPSVGGDRRDQQAARLARAERGDDAQVTGRHVVDDDRLVGAQLLARQAVLGRQRRRQRRGIDRVAADGRERLAVAAIHRAQLRAEHVTQRAGTAAADLLRRELAEQRLRDRGLAFLLPQQVLGAGARRVWWATKASVHLSTTPRVRLITASCGSTPGAEVK